MPECIGLDLGSYAIKLARLQGVGNNFKLLSASSIYNPVGQALPVDDTQFNQLAGTLHQLAVNERIIGKPIATALPESLCYTSIVSMPYLSEAELASSIHWEAEQHIPVPLEDVELEYQVLYKPKKGAVGEKMQVLLVASKKQVVDRLQLLFQTAGLELVQLSTSLLSVFRSLDTQIPQDQVVLLLNMGALSTDLVIIDSGKMVLSYTIQTGGLMLTRSVQQILGMSGQQAEEYKRTYGYDASQLEGKVKTSLDPVMNVLVTELKKAIAYYQSSHLGSSIRSVLVTGGSAYLRGITSHLAEVMSAEVSTANPFLSLGVDSGVEVPKDVAVYATAIGLAKMMVI